MEYKIYMQAFLPASKLTLSDTYFQSCQMLPIFGTTNYDVKFPPYLIEEICDSIIRRFRKVLSS